MTCRADVEGLLDRLSWGWNASISLELDRAVLNGEDEARERSNSNSARSRAWAAGPRATRPAATWMAGATIRSSGSGAARCAGIGPSSSGTRSKRSA